MPYVLTVSGSLRKDSFHTRLLSIGETELQRLGVDTDRVDLRELPRFDEDFDNDEFRPGAVAALLAKVSSADAILIATPTYNGSLPSGVKDFLDWCSRPLGAGALRGHKVGLIAASPGPRGGAPGLEYLQRILPALGSTLLKPIVSVPSVHSAFDPEGVVSTEVSSQLLDIARCVALAAKGAQVIDEPSSQRYELRLGPDGPVVGFADYRIVGDYVELPHTVTQPEFGGQGIASALIRDVLDQIRTQDRRVIPSCEFVARFIEKNPEYQTML